MKPDLRLVATLLLVLVLFCLQSAYAQSLDSSVTIPPELEAKIPPKWQTHLNSALLAWFFLSRAFKNLRAGGGLYGIYTALIWGDKTPDAKAKDDARRDEVINKEPKAP